MGVPRLMKRILFDVGPEPTEDENKLFEAAKALRAVEDDLKKRLPLPAADDALWYAKNTTETWSFELLVQDKLHEKGWPVYPGAGRNEALYPALNILAIQAEGSRTSFDMILTEYRKKGGENAGAAKFLVAHAGDLAQVVAALAAFAPDDLATRHKCVLLARAPEEKPEDFGSLSRDFGVFTSMRRVPDHLRVVPASDPPVRRPRGLQL